MHITKVRNTLGYQWNVLIPCNMYGKHDSFDPVNGHVIGSLIGKAFGDGNGPLKVFGTGKALRQFMYADDCARIVKYALTHPPGVQDVICAPPSEISIADLAAKIASEAGLELEYDRTKSDGQIRKFAKSEHFDQWYPGFEWTTLDDGLKQTILWLKQYKQGTEEVKEKGC